MRPPGTRNPCLLPAILYAAGCAAWGAEPRDLGVVRAAYGAVYNACLAAIGPEWRIDSGRSDRGLGTIVTRWRAQHAAFGKGRRTRVHVEIERRGAREQYLSFWIERERNTSMARPFSPAEGDWASDGQDREAEAVLFRQLELRIAEAIGASVSRPESGRAGRGR